jgi:xylulose-5-phosphate/fructose-6-phosphate phosphoketolase
MCIEFYAQNLSSASLAGRRIFIGASPGQNFIYIHLNRLIKEHDADIIYISGSGHGGPSLNACSYLEGTYTEVHPEITHDEDGLRLMFRKFSTPGGVPSHCGPHVPNSMHEGGELGYSLVHAFGAAFDNPDLIVACVIGDGESETCPLEGSWKSVNFLNPVRDGAVLPILHLNGYKISGPTAQGRTSDADLKALYVGRGYKRYFVEGDDPEVVHQLLAQTLEDCYAEIRGIQQKARKNGFKMQPVWPMIIFRTPKGWTCPKEVDVLSTGLQLPPQRLRPLPAQPQLRQYRHLRQAATASVAEHGRGA